MADSEENQVDKSDTLRHGDEAARQAAKEKMQQTIDSQKKDGDNEEVVTGQASLETDVSKNVTKSKGEKKEKKEKGSHPDTKILKNVKVYSPYHVYYDGDANSVSAENLTGPFDVLPGHKNFMSLLTPSEIVIRSDHGEERIKTDRAVMHVRNNMVTIFLDV